MTTVKRKYVNYTSPKGVASYPRLTSPDTKGEYADNKFKVDVEITKAEYLAEKKKLEAISKEHFGGAELCVTVLKKADKEKKLEERYFIRTKSDKMPAFWDASGKVKIDPKKDKDFVVRGGSIIKVSGGLFSHKKGLSLGLNACQIIELAAAQNGFEAEEGYSYEGPTAGGSFGDDEPEADAPAPGPDDADI